MTTSFEVVVVEVGVGGGRRGGANFAVLSFWLSTTFRLLSLS